MSELEPMTSSSSRGGYTQNLSECTSAEGLAAVIASCSPPGLQGASMEEAKGHKRALFPVFEACEDTGDEDICEVESTTGAGGSGGAAGQHVEKKRRLSVEQVKSLEKNFELENKLEPDRKIQLAKELGLQPRQVAVWFQNRRARWKTKQLEKDYDLLKLEYDELNSNYKDLMQEKEKLEEELNLLKKKLVSRGPEMKQNAEEAGAGGREDDDELNCLLPKIATSTTKVSTTAAAVMNYLKEGSSSSDSDASEVLEAESPLASRLSVVDELHRKAIPASPMSMSVTTSASASASATAAAAAAEALNFGDPPSAAAAVAVASSASFFYFPTDFHQQQQQQRSSLMKVEDWGLEEQEAMIPWWD